MKINLTIARLFLGRLLREACKHVVEVVDEKKLFRIQRITGYGEEDLYLNRWRLFESKHFGVKLHQFVRSDSDAELHNHPWDWAASLILAGGYSEERRVVSSSDNGRWHDTVQQRFFLPFSLNFLRANTFHRVDLLEEDCWTIFVTGPKVQSWGFWSRTSREFWDHHVFGLKKEKLNRAFINSGRVKA